MQVSKSAAILGEDAERLLGCRFDAEAHERLALSLENFDPDAQEEPFLTSPRSLEACLRQGITPQDLVRRCVRPCSGAGRSDLEVGGTVPISALHPAQLSAARHHLKTLPPPQAL